MTSTDDGNANVRERNASTDSTVIGRPAHGPPRSAGFGRLLPDPLTQPAAAVGVGAALLAIFLAAVALPLATYTTALAMFGLAHVGSELRYVDHRFGARLRGGLLPWLASGLAGAVAVRIAGMAGWLPYNAAIVLELAVVAAMTGVTVVSMRRYRALAAIVAAALFGCAITAPVTTFLFLAVAHNLTPLAFLADALAGAQRRRMLTLMAVPFVVLPLLIASGLPHALLAHAGLLAPNATMFYGGTLADNLGAYIPHDYLDAPWAVNAFSAAVFAQCMHYAVVILVLPRLIDGGSALAPAPGPPTILPWPSAGRFLLYLAAFALVLALGFSIDYGVARKLYALAALVHGWIEIPILVFALDRSGIEAARAG